MKITVKLFATLRANREKIMAMDLEEGSTPHEIAKRLEIPAHDIAIIMVNGRGAGINSRLNDWDVVALFPPVGGG